jgi:hypothetical protein
MVIGITPEDLHNMVIFWGGGVQFQKKYRHLPVGKWNPVDKMAFAGWGHPEGRRGSREGIHYHSAPRMTHVAIL